MVYHPLRFLVGPLLIVTILALTFFVYQTYGPAMITYFYGEQKASIFIGDTPITVEVADTPEERAAGLSNVSELPDNQGMLFVFEADGQYRFWMKDTLIPLDIIWIDSDRKIVHIERNVSPSSYPTSYGPNMPSRFVLEVNAFFVNTFNIAVGNEVFIPSHILPEDLR